MASPAKTESLLQRAGRASELKVLHSTDMLIINNFTCYKPGISVQPVNLIARVERKSQTLNLSVSARSCARRQRMNGHEPELEA